MSTLPLVLFTVEAMRQQSTCPCKQLCRYEQYEPSLSYAQLSKFNIDRMVLNDLVSRNLVENKFLLARELSQRRVPELAEADKKKLLEIRQLVDTLWDDIKIVSPTMQSDTQFASFYHILPLIDEGHRMFMADMYSLNTKLHNLGLTYWKLQESNLIYVQDYLSAMMENFLEIRVDAAHTVPGLISKAKSCAYAFPLPMDYSNVHDYFRDHAKRKKRSHVLKTATSSEFYHTDIPVYKKLHTLDDCGHYLALKQELAKDLIARHLDLDVDRQHAERLHRGVMDFFDQIFHNTSTDPQTFPKYQPCMDLVEKIRGSMFNDIDAMIEGLDLFSKANSLDTLNDSLTTLANKAYAADFTLPDFRDTCTWPYVEYLKQDVGKDYIALTKVERDLESGYAFLPTLRVSFRNLGDYAQDIYMKMKDDVVPAMMIIDDYLNGKATKLEMSEKFSSLDLNKTFQFLDALAADFSSFGREFDQGMKSMVFHVKEAYFHLFNTSLPMVSDDDFWKFNMVQYIKNSEIPELRKILDRYYQRDHLKDIIMDLYTEIQQDYTKTMAALKLRLPNEIEDMIKAITLMKQELETYSEESRMNKAFFM